MSVIRPLEPEAAPGKAKTLLDAVKASLGMVPNLFRVMAHSPATLEGFLSFNSALGAGTLDAKLRERIALAVAEHRGDGYSIAQHARTARAAGLGLDEISSARSFTSDDSREAALLAFLESVLESDGHPELHLLEEAREIGWTDEQILEAVAHLALNEFQSLVANAAALPQDQSDPQVLPNAA